MFEYDKVWAICLVLYMVVAIAVFMNEYEKFKSLIDELEGRKDENKNNRFIK